jgi:hypothetical protein
VRHPFDAIADRPRSDAAAAVGAAWLACMAGLLVGGEIEDPASFLLAAVSGAAFVFLGFAAVSRARALPQSAHSSRGGCSSLSLLDLCWVSPISPRVFLPTMNAVT